MIRTLFWCVLCSVSAISADFADQYKTVPIRFVQANTSEFVHIALAQNETGNVTSPTCSATPSNLGKQRIAGGSNMQQKCKRLWQFPYGYICETKRLPHRRSHLKAGAAP